MKLSGMGDVKTMIGIALGTCALGTLIISGGAQLFIHFAEVGANTSGRKDLQQRMQRIEKKTERDWIEGLVEGCLKRFEDIEDCPEYRDFVNPRYPEHGSNPRSSSNTT